MKIQFILLYIQETLNKRINDKRLTTNYLMEIIVIISKIKPLMKTMILQVKILKTCSRLIVKLSSVNIT